MSKNYELEVYKIIKDNNLISELGWEGDCFCIWINYRDLDEFIIKMTELFGYSLFDDGSFKAIMQKEGVCIDLCEMLGEYIDVEEVFPKETYQH